VLSGDLAEYLVAQMIRLKGVALCEVVGVTNLDDNPAPETSVDMPQSAMQVAAICPEQVHGQGA